MALSLHQIFAAPTVTRIVSRFATPLSLFQQFFGMLPGSSGAEQVSGRHVGWDIFDSTRLIATGRTPGSGPATATNKPYGHVSGVVYRMFEKQLLDETQIFRHRPPGGAIGTVDQRGQAYIANQLKYQTTRFRNAREFIVSRMLRGSFQVRLDGDDLIPVDSGGDLTVDFQIPADNKTQLDMGTGSDIIDASWDNAGTDIIAHVHNVDRAMNRLTGRPLTDIWINSAVYLELLNNTGLQNVAGTAMRVFESLTQRPETSTEGIRSGGFDVVFHGIPQFVFHVYNGGLNVDLKADSTDESDFSRFIPDTAAIFLPTPDPSWVNAIEGSEPVRENLMAESVERFGFHTWQTPAIDPPRIEVKAIDNFIPALYVPNAVAYGTVVF